MNLLDLAQSYGLSPKKVASTNGGEYKSACPRCGGSKRFWIQPYRQGKRCLGSYACRECGITGDSISFEIDILNRDEREVLQRYTSGHEVKYRKSSILSLVRTQKPSFTPKKAEDPADLWVQKASAFVKWAHQQIQANKEILEYLAKRGIDNQAVSKYNIGWNPNDLYRKKPEWGIQDDGKKIWLPKGIVIPCFRYGTIDRIKIRRTDWHEGDELGKYINVSGNKKSLSIYGNTNKDVMIVVESELDAITLAHLVNDTCFVIAVGSNIINPDSITDYLARQKKHLLICYDNDEAGLVMLKKWQKLYPNSQPFPVPIGKDIGEAIQRGFDIRKWLNNKIESFTVVNPTSDTPVQVTQQIENNFEIWNLDELALITWWKRTARICLPGQQTLYEEIEKELNNFLNRKPVKKEWLIGVLKKISNPDSTN